MDFSSNTTQIAITALVGFLGTVLFLGYQRKRQNKNVKEQNKVNNTEFSLMDTALKLQIARQDEEALKLFNKVLEKNKNNNLAYYLKGESEAQLGQIKEAEKSYLQALKLQKTPEVYLSLGNIYQKQLKFHLALEQYDKSIELKEKNPTAYLNKGIIFHQTEKIEDCLKCFDKAIDLGLKEAYVHKALTLHKLGRLEESLEVFDQVIAKYPDNTQNYFHKANTYVAMGKYEEAQECYKTIQKYDPNNVNIQMRIEKLQELIQAKKN